MKCHEVEYEIIGNSMQLVELTLNPGETAIAEAGAMSYMDNDIVFETRMGDGGRPEGFFSILFSAGKRVMTGESLFMTHFTNEGPRRQKAAFAAPFPGSVIAVNLSEYGNKVVCQKDAFLAAALGTTLDIEFTKRVGAGAFGEEGFVLRSLKGDGMIFLHAGGTLIRRDLRNETLKADSGALVGFTQGIDYDVKWVGSIKSAFFGEEGMMVTTLSGTGTVWLQSLPFPRLIDRISESLPKPTEQ